MDKQKNTKKQFFIPIIVFAAIILGFVMFELPIFYKYQMSAREICSRRSKSLFSSCPADMPIEYGINLREFIRLDEEQRKGFTFDIVKAFKARY